MNVRTSNERRAPVREHPTLSTLIYLSGGALVTLVWWVDSLQMAWQYASLGVSAALYLYVIGKALGLQDEGFEGFEEFEELAIHSSNRDEVDERASLPDVDRTADDEATTGAPRLRSLFMMASILFLLVVFSTLMDFEQKGQTAREAEPTAAEVTVQPRPPDEATPRPSLEESAPEDGGVSTIVVSTRRSNASVAIAVLCGLLAVGAFALYRIFPTATPALGVAPALILTGILSLRPGLTFELPDLEVELTREVLQEDLLRSTRLEILGWTDVFPTAEATLGGCDQVIAASPGAGKRLSEDSLRRDDLLGLVLIGYADERSYRDRAGSGIGTNRQLAERRAEWVRDHCLDDPSVPEVVLTFGAGPVNFGADENAWQEDRRVLILGWTADEAEPGDSSSLPVRIAARSS